MSRRARPHPGPLRAASALLRGGLLAALLGGCAQAPTAPPPAPALPPALEAALAFSRAPGWPQAEWLLVGEEHDAPDHQAAAAHLVGRLAGEGRLAALALEMAESGRSTAGLPAQAEEATVREALGWVEAAWPWAAYGPAVMAAVRAGVPVHGANLPRAAMRETLEQVAIDGWVSPGVRERLQEDVRRQHCELLPAAKLPGMTRIQIARDAAMAATLLRLRQPGRVVLLMAGHYHVHAELGVPRQMKRLGAEAGPGRLLALRLEAGGALPPTVGLGGQSVPTPAIERPADPCAGLRVPPAAPPAR